MNPPLIRAIADLRRNRSYGALALYLLCAVVSLYLLALAVSPPLQRMLMRCFHLRTSSYAGWALQQAVPNMYSFSNRLEIEIPPLRTREEGIKHVNHFPIQLVTNPWNRHIYFWNYGHTVLSLHSTYRGQSVSTRYRLAAKPEPAVVDLEIVPDEVD